MNDEAITTRGSGRPTLTRRAFGGSVAATLLGLGTSLRETSAGVVRPDAGLNARARRNGRFFGSAVDQTVLTGEPETMARIAAECGIVVGEASFKWQAIRPTQSSFEFDAADRLMDFAAQRGLHVRGHTLVWHEANPAWLASALTQSQAEHVLTNHIHTVASHFRGRLVHWDVVNEPLAPDDGRRDGLRQSAWLRAIGPRYIDLAFHACAAADPAALRVLNEFGTDYTLPWQARRREALLELLADLRGRNVPIQAVGLQAHLNAAETGLDQGVLNRFVADIASLGLQVIVTELDVRDDGLPADIGIRDDAVAAHAGAWLDAVLDHPAVLGVLSWGLTDRRSWLNARFPRSDRLPQRPLPLDVGLARKPLWSTIAASLDAAGSRLASP